MNGWCVYNNAIRAIHTKNIRMITHIVTYYKDILEDFIIEKLTYCAIDKNEHMIAYILNIYRNPHHPLDSKPNVYFNIGNMFDMQSLGLLSDWILHGAAITCNVANFKIVKYTHNVDDDYIIHCIKDAYNSGHLSFIYLFTPEEFAQCKPWEAIYNGYINVAKHCIKNNIYFNSRRAWYSSHMRVNTCITLLLDHGLIDHNCFSQKATKTLINMGYIIKNKHTRSFKH